MITKTDLQSSFITKVEIWAQTLDSVCRGMYVKTRISQEQSWWRLSVNGARCSVHTRVCVREKKLVKTYSLNTSLEILLAPAMMNAKTRIPVKTILMIPIFILFNLKFQFLGQVHLQQNKKKA